MRLNAYGFIVSTTALAIAGSASINQDPSTGFTADTLQQIHLPPGPSSQVVYPQAVPPQTQTLPSQPASAANPPGSPQNLPGQPSVAQVVGQQDFPQGSSQNSPTSDPKTAPSDLSLLSGAIVEYMFKKKAILVQFVANILQLILGSSAITVGRLMASFMGVQTPPPQQSSARSAQSGPQYGAQSDPVLDNGMSFILPVLNRPLQYQDFQVLERLVVESVDVYNKWQKKSTSVSGQSAVVQQRQSGQ